MCACLRNLVPLAKPDKSAGWMAVCALLSCGYALAGETSDPFSTGAKPSPASALHIGLAEPCADTRIGSRPDARINHALDLPAVVNIVLCNNPQTREAWANSQAQAAQIGISQAGYFPIVSASVSGNQNSPGNRQRSVVLSLSYLLYDFGARAANLETARQTLAALSATQDNTVQTLFLAAVQAYYQTLATQAAFEAAKVSEHAAQQSFAVADARYLAGSAISADKFSARAAWSQATLNRITARGAMQIAQGNLANLLGLDANRQVSLLANQNSSLAAIDDKNLNDFEQNVAVLIEQARQHRPDLQAAQATLKAAEASADAARAAGKPTVTLTATSNQSNSAGINTHGSSLGVSLNVPLFSGYAPTYRIRAAEAQIETRKAQMERIRLQVALDVWTAWQNLATATQNMRSTADLLDSTTQAERVSLGRYKAGAGIMLDVLNAQNTLASARQQRIQASFNWNISRAALAQAMGKLDAGVLASLTDADSGNSLEPKP